MQTIKTTAETISSLLNDDGMTWETDDGRHMNDLLDEFDGEKVAGKAGDAVYRFSDGSAIFTVENYWDLATLADNYDAARVREQLNVDDGVEAVDVWTNSTEDWFLLAE